MSDQDSGWNSGFFNGQGEIGEASRNFLPYDISSLLSTKEVEEDEYVNGNSGWNKGFFAGQESLGEVTRNFWNVRTLDNNESHDTRQGDIDNDLTRDTNHDDHLRDNEDRQNAYQANQNTINNEIDNARTQMIFSDKSLDEIQNRFTERQFADNDNYERFVNLKRDTQSKVSFYLYIVFVYSMSIILTFMIIWELLIFFKMFDGTIRPNWGMIMIPILILSIHRSFNSYSLIKILF